MAVGHAIEDIFEISVWLRPIELRRLEQRSDHCPTVGAAVGPGEEVVLAPQSHGPDGALDRIVVELDATVLEEPAQRRPACEGIADRFGEAAARRHLQELVLQPGFEGLDQGTRVAVTVPLALGRTMAANLGLDRIEPGDPAQCLGRDRRSCRLMEVVKLSAACAPSLRQDKSWKGGWMCPETFHRAPEGSRRAR